MALITVELLVCVTYIPTEIAVVFDAVKTAPPEAEVFATTLSTCGVAPSTSAARETYSLLPYAKKLAAVKNVSALKFVGLPNLETKRLS